MDFDWLSNLKILDMKEWSRLKKLHNALAKLRYLIHVIYDESIEQECIDIKSSTMPYLTVVVVK